MEPFEPLCQSVEAPNNEVRVTALASEEPLVGLLRERAVSPSLGRFIGPYLGKELGINVRLLANFVTHVWSPGWPTRGLFSQNFSATGREMDPTFFGFLTFPFSALTGGSRQPTSKSVQLSSGALDPPFASHRGFSANRRIFVLLLRVIGLTVRNRPTSLLSISMGRSATGWARRSCRSEADKTDLLSFDFTGRSATGCARRPVVTFLGNRYRLVRFSQRDAPPLPACSLARTDRRVAFEKPLNSRLPPANPQSEHGLRRT